MPNIIGYTFRIAMGISILALLLVATAQAQVIIPYLDTGYKYKEVAWNENMGFESPSFDGSGFSVGDAGFGTQSCSASAKTYWSPNTDILLRKEFNLPSGATNLKIGVAIDNDVQVFINGHDVSGGLIAHEGCAAQDNLVFTVPDTTLKTGSNLLAIRARDRGEINYIDVQVTGDVVIPTPTPTPSPTPTLSPTPSPATLTVTSPNGGEKWQIGSTETIQWAYTGNPGTSVKIELLKSLNDPPVATIEPKAPIGSNGKGSYPWLINPPFGVRYLPGAYLIRITGNDGSTTDTSDVHFELTSRPANQPPEKPSKLGQFKSDGKTSITTGDTTNERTIVFKATVSDSDKDQVKLQIELRRLDEYGGQFDEAQGGLKESALVPSGRQATITVNDLIDAKYHWRARAIDANGNKGDWQEFGGNDISAADFVVSVPSTLPIPADSHRIKVLNENDQPLEEATIRMSYSEKTNKATDKTTYGLPLVKADNTPAKTNKEGFVDIFFKDQKEKNNIVIRAWRDKRKDGKDNRPWSTCTSVNGYETKASILWECQLPLNGPQIMATKSTTFDTNTDKKDGTPAYARLGWTIIIDDPRCTSVGKEEVDKTCYTDKNFLSLRNDFRGNLYTILKPFRIERYKPEYTSDPTVLGYLRDTANTYQIPLPILAAIMTTESAVCRWNTPDTCSKAQLGKDIETGKYSEWSLITFDGGIGAMQLTGGTALSAANANELKVSPDKGLDSLSASLKSNTMAGGFVLNSKFNSKLKKNPKLNRNVISDWGGAIIAYNGDSGYSIKNNFVPFYKVTSLNGKKKYIEDDSLPEDRKSYVTIGEMWTTACGVENINGKDLWVCQ